MSYCCIGHHLNNEDALWCAACGSLVEGAMVGNYRLLSYIGNGSAADVYLAEQPSLSKRKVVIKILHSSWSEARVSNFQREAAALASLAHPYILPIFAYDVLYKQAKVKQQPERQEPLPYLVLPYAEQGSLAEILSRQGKRPWSLTRVVTIVKEIAEALDYAHARGILHRDVKPANILQMGSHAVLSDFSVAALIDADISHLSTPWAGSPGYMAPEVWQLHPGRYSDQYALAVSGYYLLATQLPWQRSSNARSQSWLELHCFVPPRSILELRPNLPLAVDVVLKRALSKDPHDRYATVQAFANDLYSASQDITQVIGSQPGKQRSRRIVAQPALIGTPTHGEEKQKQQQPILISAQDRPASQATTTAPDVQSKVPATPPPDSVRHPSEVSTNMFKSNTQNDKWVWSALALNLLICLAVAAEYAWQLGKATTAANMLLAVWPGLLTGPLLAYLFRRVNYSRLSWGLFWGVFFGLTDALVSILLCIIWVALVSLSTQYHCPSWCESGDGFKIISEEIINLAAQAIVPVVLTLWIAVIGGAIIGVGHIRSR
jgi:serine/threonine protein kinase